MLEAHKNSSSCIQCSQGMKSAVLPRAFSMTFGLPKIVITIFFFSPLLQHHGSGGGCRDGVCNNHRRCECRSRSQIHSPPRFDHTSIYCSCYHCQRSNGVARANEQSHTSHIHLATNNITYPTPYYATSLAPFNGMHSSWEPTFHREYNTRLVSRVVVVLLVLHLC